MYDLTIIRILTPFSCSSSSCNDIMIRVNSELLKNDIKQEYCKPGQKQKPENTDSFHLPCKLPESYFYNSLSHKTRINPDKNTKVTKHSKPAGLIMH